MNTKKIILGANILSATCIIATLIVIIWNYQSMSNQIAVHYDLDGTPNRYGSKVHVFIIWGIAFAIFALLMYLQRHPERTKVNIPINDKGMPQNLTRGQWSRQMKINKLMLALTNVMNTLLFGTLTMYMSFEKTPNPIVVGALLVALIAIIVCCYYKLSNAPEDGGTFIKEQIENSRTLFLKKADSTLLDELRVLNGTQYLPEGKRLQLIGDVRSTHTDIIEYLKTQAPELNDDDITYCLLSCLGLRNNSISACMATSEEALRKRKSRIRKKMAEELSAYLFDENYGI